MSKYYFQDQIGRVYQSARVDGWNDCTKLTAKQGAEMYREQKCAELRNMLQGEKPVIYTSILSVSASGMSRTIKVLLVEDGRIRDISYAASVALQWSEGKNGGVKVGGCGMDMGFHLVYLLSSVLFADGYHVKHEWV